jgi:hypothetical protein
VLAAEHLLDLGRLDFALQIVESAGEVRLDRLALLEPFGQDREILAALFQGVAEGDVLFQPAATLEQLLGLGLIRPEVRLRDTRFDASDFVIQSCGLKDNSACRRTASSGPDTVASDRHGQ